MTYGQKRKIRDWAENVFVPQLERKVTEGTVVSFSKSKVSESFYIQLYNDSLNDSIEIRISDHINNHVMGRDYTVYMSHTNTGKAKGKRQIKDEVLDYIPLEFIKENA
jgi:hypothetical protein